MLATLHLPQWSNKLRDFNYFCIDNIVHSVMINKLYNGSCSELNFLDTESQKKVHYVISTKDIICSIQYVAGTHMFLCGGSVAVLSLWVCVNFALSHIQERF